MTTTTTAMATPSRITAKDLAKQLAAREVTLIDVREPMEYASGHISGSLNVPLSRITETDLPSGPLVLVCQSGKRSTKALTQLLQQGHPHPLADLEGGVPAWQQAGRPLRKLKGAPLPLMRQVQIAAGSLVLLGLILSNTVAPAWILLTWFVGAGLTFAGITGFCGMARLLAAMPWNKVTL
ncbi:rhodanese-like domain-containing protein [Synechococcus sp. CBW1107]|jgi:rhodanese-related sulfurtransferase|uniref:rhodanese-like domain-containing protein n=1 Tax=Synechococcus sp. CBW1107 TaxID=2789857 RepID=UPI0018CD6098|nr:rhodanese-like domain-containing protein [Synechococcus sp. CBW1107]QPN57304.1 rhodanese-like domain-containing protein [Synechococcus sp. CBW1107]CAK6693147.1 Inner membrane protein YgaP [Synechococcus sp. CBW1107]